MTRFTVTIDTDNDAFDTTGVEIARILRDLADHPALGSPHFQRFLYDVNGNRVGVAQQHTMPEEAP